MHCVNGKPILAYSIDAFENCKYVKDIIIVTQEDKIEIVSEICKKFRFKKVSHVIKGGATRLESVINGVFAVSKKAPLIAIHDGARPCVDNKIIEDTILKAAMYNAAAPGIAITSTVKRTVDGVIKETVDREGLYEIQTPQIFRAELIKAALVNAKKKAIDITDDCMAAEIIGVNIHIVEGSRKNIKITELKDFEQAESFLSEDNTER